MHEPERRGAAATGLPRPPQVERRIGHPPRLLGLLVLFLALPALAVSGLLGDGAPQRVLRVGVVFAVLLVMFRVIGKRELSRLSPFELVTLMLVPEVLSDAVQTQGPLVDALVALSTLFLLVLFSSVLAHRFRGVEKAMEPQPTILVEHGRLLEDALNRERILPDELFSEMRRHGVLGLQQVDWAVLESSGNITIVPRNTPVAPPDEDPSPS